MSSQKFGKDTHFLSDWINKHDNKIVIIPNALDAKGEEKLQENLKEDIELLKNIGFDVTVIDLKKYFGQYNKLREELLKYNACCVMGGNVFVLNKAMNLSGFDIFLKEKKNDDNYLYIGYSAGSCVLSRNLEKLDIVDEPIKFYDESNVNYNGLGFVDYVIIPHYKSNYHKANLILEAVEKCKNENIEFKTIQDGEVLIEQIK
jgi:dipeptidase E